MRVSNLLPVALSPMAMGLVVPRGIAHVTPEQVDQLIAKRVDFPENPRLNVGDGECFEVQNIPEGEVRTNPP